MKCERGWDGSTGQGGRMGLEVGKDREVMVRVCVYCGWVTAYMCVRVSFANDRRKNRKTGEESAKGKKKTQREVRLKWRNLHPHISKQTPRTSHPWR